jgi:glycosyltransferase involved in cell wall biosynthesis
LLNSRACIYEVGNGVAHSNRTEEIDEVKFRILNGISLEDRVILFIGRITEKKGIHYLIEAMPEIVRLFPKAKLVICGDRRQNMSYVRRLDQLAGRLSIDRAIVWAGFLNEKEKPSALKSACIFAHPSYSEGMALAILEAMSAGLPTVVTPGCYMDSARDFGAVWEVEQTPRELSKSIVKLLSDPSKARLLGDAGRKYVNTWHRWEGIAQQMDLVYRGEARVSVAGKSRTK